MICAKIISLCHLFYLCKKCYPFYLHDLYVISLYIVAQVSSTGLINTFKIVECIVCFETQGLSPAHCLYLIV